VSVAAAKSEAVAPRASRMTPLAQRKSLQIKEIGIQQRNDERSERQRGAMRAPRGTLLNHADACPDFTERRAEGIGPKKTNALAIAHRRPGDHG